MKIPRSLFVLFPLVLAACSSSSSSDTTTGGNGGNGNGNGGSGGGSSMYPGCPRNELESDLAVVNPTTGDSYPQSAKSTTWMGGSALDPMTHELKLAKGTYLVSSTRLALKPGQEVYGQFMALSGPVIADIFTNPGALAFSTAISKKCNTARTLVIWKDMQSMMTLVAGKAHSAAASQYETVSRGGSTVTHWEAKDDAIDWGEAAIEIGKAEPID